MEHLLEICVDSLESALAAQEGGADRLELCANLIIGGTSPSPALIRQVQEAVNIPVNVLLRPRFGDFCFTPAEQDAMVWEVEECRRLGVNGVVLGALTPDGRLDRALLSRCIEAAGPSLHRTLHRAFETSAATRLKSWRAPLRWVSTPSSPPASKPGQSRAPDCWHSWWRKPPDASPSWPAAA